MYQWIMKPQIVMQFKIAKGCLLSMLLKNMKLQVQLWTCDYKHLAWVACQQNSLRHYINVVIQNYPVIISSHADKMQCTLIFLSFVLSLVVVAAHQIYITNRRSCCAVVLTYLMVLLWSCLLKSITSFIMYHSV